MENYFLVKANYSKVIGNDNKNVVESYLFEVISYKDAEDKAIAVLKDNISGEFSISDIKKASYNEILYITEDCDENIEKFWYECKALLVIIDEASGNEKKITEKVLVQGISIESALKRLNNSLKESNDSNFRILSIIETPILGIYDYHVLENEDKEN